ncbi:STM4504/CBY_0614 family protein [Oceanobacter kriegii]|uniref:STM4504/CBY_0614 family protein n=1 Tax=Oceanobacter kriegii TaxID=64972 RepID=UPI000421C46D|nr:hypothetical protein [Oceanobacter kriegii]
MPIIELYSTRNKNIYPDTYQYDFPSRTLRVQLAKIIGDAIGEIDEVRRGLDKYGTCSYFLFRKAHELISKEYGEETLNGYRLGSYNWAKELILSENRVERFLDALELFCTLISKDVERDYYNFSKQGGAKQKPKEAVKEINERMKRDGFGYEYIDGIIIKIDQDFTHSEVTKPALFLLSEFEGARHEFLNAHEHYRHNRYEESLNYCNKSLESLLQQICKEQSWNFKKGTVNALIPICMDNGLIPTYLQTQLSSLPTLVSQGVASIRNNVSGHGQGAEVRVVPEHIITYALHLTASNIVFISQCYQEMLKS